MAAIGLPLVAAIALPTALSNRGARDVTIQVTPPSGARDVRLSGSMNGWSQERMTDLEGDGTFELKLELAAGTYAYRVVADGRPVEDLQAGADGIRRIEVPADRSAAD
jgi:1,4-alpha-glucan branching enzyme